MFGFGKKRNQDGAEAPRTAKKDGPPAWPEDPDALSAEELRSLAARFSALGTPEGTASANRLHMKAAEKGDALAQLYVAQDYANGLGVDRDPEKAAEWYAKAANQGLASAQDALGMAYEKGTGVAQDPEKAAELYGKAADQGYAMAQFHLGKLYEDGRGVARDFVTAADFYRKAADQGSKEAQCNLGVLYRDGAGVELDPAKAVELLSKSAAQGYKYAQFELGMMYYRGRGTEVDYPKAVEWLTKAADRGFIPAKYYLGTCYEKGLGVEPDFDRAVELYRAGEERGYMMAGRKMMRLRAEGKVKDEPSEAGRPRRPHQRSLETCSPADAGIFTFIVYASAVRCCSIVCVRYVLGPEVELWCCDRAAGADHKNQETAGNARPKCSISDKPYIVLYNAIILQMRLGLWCIVYYRLNCRQLFNHGRMFRGVVLRLSYPVIIVAIVAAILAASAIPPVLGLESTVTNSGNAVHGVSGTYGDAVKLSHILGKDNVEGGDGGKFHNYNDGDYDQVYFVPGSDSPSGYAVEYFTLDQSGGADPSLSNSDSPFRFRVWMESSVQYILFVTVTDSIGDANIKIEIDWGGNAGEVSVNSSNSFVGTKYVTYGTDPSKNWAWTTVLTDSYSDSTVWVAGSGFNEFRISGDNCSAIKVGLIAKVSSFSWMEDPEKNS